MLNVFHWLIKINSHFHNKTGVIKRAGEKSVNMMNMVWRCACLQFARSFHCIRGSNYWMWVIYACSGRRWACCTAEKPARSGTPGLEWFTTSRLCPWRAVSRGLYHRREPHIKQPIQTPLLTWLQCRCRPWFPSRAIIGHPRPHLAHISHSTSINLWPVCH